MALSWDTTPPQWIQDAARMAADKGGQWGWGPLVDGDAVGGVVGFDGETIPRAAAVGGAGVRPWAPECAPWVVSAVKGVKGSPYKILVTGRGPWQDLRMFLGAGKPDAEGHRPWRVMLWIGSSRLWAWACGGQMWQEHARDAYSCAKATLGILCVAMPDGPAPLIVEPDETLVRVARFDVCMDHWDLGAWTLDDLDMFATKATGRGVLRTDTGEELSREDAVAAYRGKRSITLYVGKRGTSARVMRAYNKIEEAKVSGKTDWMAPIWAQCGWDGVSVVWRVEFEHGGDFLRGGGFATLDKLPGAERTLWDKAMAETRHVVTDNAIRKRCSDSARWKELRESAKRQKPGPWRWDPRPVTESEDMEGLDAQAAGCLARKLELLLRGPASMTVGDDGMFVESSPQAQEEALEAMIADVTAAAVAKLRERLEKRRRQALKGQTGSL